MWKWIALGTGFGALSGPFVSAVVNHGHPVYASIFAAPFLVFIGLLFLNTVVKLDQRPWRSALPSVVAVVVGGGVLFMLPHAWALPATGDFWWRTDAERYAVYCAPYPCVSWLVFSHARHRLIPLATSVAVAACLVSAWPKLHLGATAQTAAVLRNELGLPTASLYTVGISDAEPTDGYYADGTTVSVTYNIGTRTETSAPNLGFDLELTVYPAHGTSPCPDLFRTLANMPAGEEDVLGDGIDETCQILPQGRWQYSSAHANPDYATEIERVGGYYIALTVDTQTVATPFSLLFASLHHPDNAELVAIGLDHSYSL